MSKAVRFHAIGDPEVLSIDDVEVPAPREGEVLIRTRALGLNRADVMFRTGNHFAEPTFPQAFGLEAAGTVQAVGSDVTHVTVGDAVSVVPATPLTEYPLHGDLVLAPARAVVKHASTLSWEAAASLWMAYVTAYGGLIDLGNLQKGDAVAITAGSSSVGLAAIQIANMVGAKPIAITRSADKRQRLLDAGAAGVIATETEDVTATLNELTGGTGVKLIFDPVAGPQVEQLLGATAPDATVLIYGALSSEPITLPVLPLLKNRLTIRGYDMAAVTTDDGRLQKAVSFINDGVERGLLAPIIDRTYTFEDAVQAYQYLESNVQFGKVVMTVPQST
ncbi:hypothetical protein EEB12_29335 [Rhodococcus sp. WS1]|uniref:zinc-dependent alcohol dehydrogenase family protein n=1 Tax=unclassified Rhodococcus (in: high G+C Gram-positive bacteria) TaxID=192944 RepID=UPI001142E281|nr:MULTISPECIES: zinc-dependent alcohol dehydrogenase family protein [unclassified Rhodococcus (in: high G+C Gram-positive bacteria)]ROZ52932.1 hypothetical protein EEB12_29335 [Rhodococcus sp. WS1]TQC36023.1 hypothetical protein EEB16_20920 [Rhodococcus sp. WS7]